MFFQKCQAVVKMFNINITKSANQQEHRLSMLSECCNKVDFLLHFDYVHMRLCKLQSCVISHVTLLRYCHLVDLEVLVGIYTLQAKESCLDWCW